ncbi:sugar phosphate isomerase/epimerase [Candidatus Poribacteria bacterium]|nr:sugar phosphate isomerase/epimerase [Candidatus Poribacteria bacterium]MYB01844.1 sugar phosphate isomerase/epimerase [Candidatus Poribacteria bacterium]
MKIAICNEMFEDWKIEDVFTYAAELGYEAVEIAPFTLADSVLDISQTERARIRKAAADAKIEIAGLHWLLVSPPGLYVNHPDAEIREETRDYFLALVNLCADLGGEVMVIGSPQQRNVMDPLSFDEAWEYARATFSESAALAGERGVMLCMEPLSSDQTNFITHPDTAVEMVKAVNHPNFEMILDVCSTAKEGIDMPTQIRKHAPHVAHFHSNDDNGYLPGSGGVDYPPIIEALKEIDYKGYVSTEVFDFKPDPQTIAKQSIEFVKSLL